MSRFSITTPIFYVNAPPHIGHAYTVVAADVLARFHRLRGDEVFFLTGTDEHGAKIAEAAKGAGQAPQVFADRISAEFQAVWQALDVRLDDFIRTTETRHAQGVNTALTELQRKGVLYEKSYQGLYCTGCENFLTEKDLDASGKCPLHNRKPEVVEERNWFFKISQYLADVKVLIQRDVIRVGPEERKNEVLGLFEQGLDDFSVSRSKARVGWGIPLPFDDTQTTYVWVDALLNYLTALGYGSGDTTRLDRYWPADVHMIGQDILKFHAVYWPALLLALGLENPKEIFVHGFFTVDGRKVSKSLGNAIDPLALVTRYGSDAARFLLLSQFPFGTSGDVNVARFDEQYNAILANTIGNLVSRTIALLQKFSDGKIPDAPADHTFSQTVLAEKKSVEEATSPGNLLDALVREPVQLAIALNQYADRTAPWKETDPAKRATALRTLADGVVSLALLAEPVLPRASPAIQTAFGVVNRQRPTPGTTVRSTDPAILFPRAKDLQHRESLSAPDTLSGST